MIGHLGRPTNAQSAGPAAHTSLQDDRIRALLSLAAPPLDIAEMSRFRFVGRLFLSGAPALLGPAAFVRGGL